MDTLKPSPEEVAKQACSSGDTAQAAAFIVLALPDPGDRELAFLHLADSCINRAPSKSPQGEVRRDLVRMSAPEHTARSRIGRTGLAKARLEWVRQQRPKLDS